MYNTVQHLTVAWFYYWIRALGHMELSMLCVCDGKMPLLCAVFMYVKPGCVNREVMEREEAA